MSNAPESQNRLSDEFLAYYDGGDEAQRLMGGRGQLELARTQELVERYAPSLPAVILDVGGGSGIYACWLAKKGYEVHLVDAVPFLVEQARQASQNQPDFPIASLRVGDARELDRPDESVDVVLLFGPLYHLTDRDDRVTALREARRILRKGGVVLAAAISRFASTFGGLAHGVMDDPEFVRIAKRDLVDGQHRNPDNHPGYFTTAFFHHPDELKAEVRAAGLNHLHTLAIEGMGSFLGDFDTHWENASRRERLLDVIRSMEDEPATLGATAHMMAVARKDS